MLNCGKLLHGLVGFLESSRWAVEISYFSPSSWCMELKTGGTLKVVKC